MNLSSAKAALITIALSSLSISASAHTGVDAHSHSSFISGVLSGFVHPLAGLDHLAAMVAVGLWSALTARRAGAELLWGPAGFAALLLVGAALGLGGVALPGVEPMIAASLLVIGLLVASRQRMPGAVAALLVGVFAVFHGLAHGHELAGHTQAAATVVGMLAATVLLHAAGLGLGWALRSRPVWLGRAAGASVAALGAGLLAQMV